MRCSCLVQRSSLARIASSWQSRCCGGRGNVAQHVLSLLHASDGVVGMSCDWQARSLARVQRSASLRSTTSWQSSRSSSSLSAAQQVDKALHTALPAAPACAPPEPAGAAAAGAPAPETLELSMPGAAAGSPASACAAAWTAGAAGAVAVDVYTAAPRSVRHPYCVCSQTLAIFSPSDENSHAAELAVRQMRGVWADAAALPLRPTCALPFRWLGCCRSIDGSMNRKQRRAQAKITPHANTGAVARALPQPAPVRAERIRFVVATRESRDTFVTNTAMGRSLALYRYDFVELRLAFENTRGLPEIYNIAIEEARNDPAILVFVHDDVHLLDYFFAERVLRSLDKFQVIGLAGNKRRVPRQPGWAFIDDKLTWDVPENLSGVVGHGTTFPPSNLSVFGAPGQEVKLLDGVMLIARSKTLIDHGLRFDETFDFHFYDMDFCRQAEAKHVSMGTFALPVIHESGGNFGSPGWQKGYQTYLEKWKS
jgi:hypothetical protein